ncbi:hypothetical protein SGPA1_31105 [Streptomyces misionensis JCM 4497]
MVRPHHPVRHPRRGRGLPRRGAGPRGHRGGGRAGGGEAPAGGPGERGPAAEADREGVGLTDPAGGMCPAVMRLPHRQGVKNTGVPWGTPKNQS